MTANRPTEPRPNDGLTGAGAVEVLQLAAWQVHGAASGPDRPAASRLKAGLRVPRSRKGGLAALDGVADAFKASRHQAGRFVVYHRPLPSNPYPVAMRIITLNANGIRSAQRKGFFDWLRRQRADVVCIQETKAQEHQLTDPDFHPRYMKGGAVYHDAEKKGYSGVALYMRKTPDRVQSGIGWATMDTEGRWLQADFGKLSVISLYLPSGSSGEHRQAIKFQVMDYLKPHLERLAADGREYIICGDWNIAHRKIDLKNWRSNQKNSGFLPEERAWMDEIFGPIGLVDGFRQVDPRPEQYTWWSNRGRAREKNVGWRLDYQVITPGLAGVAERTRIYTDRKFSDHAPLVLDYDC